MAAVRIFTVPAVGIVCVADDGCRFARRTLTAVPVPLKLGCIGTGTLVDAWDWTMTRRVSSVVGIIMTVAVDEASVRRYLSSLAPFGHVSNLRFEEGQTLRC